MPYITQDRRRLVGVNEAPQNCGELNYLFSMAVLQSDDMHRLQSDLEGLCLQYICAKGLKYQHINDVMGAIFGAKAEMVRRTGKHKFDSLFDDVARSFYATVAGPYEDTKIVENGDLPYPEPKWTGEMGTGRLPPMQEQGCNTTRFFEVQPGEKITFAPRDRTDPEGGIPGRG